MASTAVRMSAPGRQVPPATLAAICSGFVAPAITEATAGRASSQPKARSSTLWPSRPASSSSAATAASRSSDSWLAARSPMAASRVPSGGGAPARYLPLSSPLASGKKGRNAVPVRSQYSRTPSSGSR